MTDSNEEASAGAAEGTSGGAFPGPAPFSERESFSRILREPGTQAETIRSILEDSRLMSQYWVRALLALRSDVPLGVSLRIIPSLWWRDLARVVEHPRVFAPVRARAEQLLGARFEEMSLDESQGGHHASH